MRELVCTRYGRSYQPIHLVSIWNSDYSILFSSICFIRFFIQFSSTHSVFSSRRISRSLVRRTHCNIPYYSKIILLKWFSNDSNIRYLEQPVHRWDSVAWNKERVRWLRIKEIQNGLHSMEKTLNRDDSESKSLKERNDPNYTWAIAFTKLNLGIGMRLESLNLARIQPNSGESQRNAAIHLSDNSDNC